ncbi:hypothetical protein H0O00_04210 [Candidatus Micrarchaeota archaeon]|nr:hypothetical protein [Candidatus Micrarchaeota archaeon]
MEQLTRPPNLTSSVQRARQFYTRFKALPLYEHCHGVFRRAAEEGIIEGEQIKQVRSDEAGRKLAWFHSIIAETMLYHVVDAGKLVGGAVDLSFLKEDHPLLNSDIRTELGVFSRLTELDRIGAPASDYGTVLNNDHAPRALLARLTDYAVTHNTEDRTPGHISHHPSPLFRMYSSKADAKKRLEMDAKAGEKIYAPVAELFGFPLLAGDIFKHVYRINHPVVHDHVVEIIAKEQAEGRLGATQAIARRLVKVLRRTFTDSGFDVEVVPRLEKHEGKTMRKFYNQLVDRHKALPSSYSPPLEEFVASTIREYTLSSLNDTVALKVILDNFNGRQVDAMPEEQKLEVIQAALDMVTVQLNILKIVEGYAHRFDPQNKKNGYIAYHFDAKPIGRDNLLPLEVQVKTRVWDDIASHGKAAHYYYIGGDPAFIELVSNAYRDIIHRKQGSDNGR